MDRCDNIEIQERASVEEMFEYIKLHSMEAHLGLSGVSFQSKYLTLSTITRFPGWPVVLILGLTMTLACCCKDCMDFKAMYTFVMIP